MSKIYESPPILNVRINTDIIQDFTGVRYVTIKVDGKDVVLFVHPETGKLNLLAGGSKIKTKKNGDDAVEFTL